MFIFRLRMGLLELVGSFLWLGVIFCCMGRYKCVHHECDAEFDDADKAREHERENNLHWITDSESEIGGLD